jgi:thymidine phosphorylase
MQTKAEARKLAQVMVRLGNQCGVRTRAFLTNMDVPLGRAAGNWLEVKEAVACLSSISGRARHSVRAAGPNHKDGAQRTDAPYPQTDDLRSLVLECAAHLLVQTGKAKSLVVARKLAEDCLASGAPRRKWEELIVAQGADLDAFNRKLALDHTTPVVLELRADRTGFVSKCDARLIGEAIRDLGGGRLTKESAINYDVGVDQLAKPGEEVKAGSTLARIHAADRVQAEAARARLKAAFEFSAKPLRTPPLISEVITR